MQLGAILWAAAAVLAAPDDAPRPLQQYAFSQVEMAMPFEIVLYAPDEATAKEASQAAFARIHELNNVFSDYDSASELSQLSATSGSGKAIQISQPLFDVLAFGQELSGRSDGAFDVTAGPIIRLWRRARRNGRLPTEEALAAAQAQIGYQHMVLSIEQRTAQLARRDMRLDLGGIAVGYAIDDALRLLRERGLTRAMVDGSGDIVVGDPPPGKEGWKVGIAPLQPDAPPRVFVMLKNASITTSGDAFQHVTIDGRRYSHIVDPKTGLGISTPSSVTVVAPTGIQADALATAISVLGPERGLPLLDGEPDRITAGCAVYIVRNVDGKVQTSASRGWHALNLEAPK